MKDGLSMTLIILKTGVWKEDVHRIAGRKANGGIAVFGSATGQAFARMKNDLSVEVVFKCPLHD
jgi:hypothetical protein